MASVMEYRDSELFPVKISLPLEDTTGHIENTK